jgi:hypothetical protein
MDNADTGLGGSPQSIRDHLWGREGSPMIYRLHKKNYKIVSITEYHIQPVSAPAGLL